MSQLVRIMLATRIRFGSLNHQPPGAAAPDWHHMWIHARTAANPPAGRSSAMQRQAPQCRRRRHMCVSRLGYAGPPFDRLDVTHPSNVTRSPRGTPSGGMIGSTWS